MNSTSHHETQDKQTNGTNAPSHTGAISQCGKILLLSAAYQIFAVGMSHASTQNPPADPHSGKSALENALTRMSTFMLGFEHVLLACIGCTTGPDNIPCGGTGSSGGGGSSARAERYEAENARIAQHNQAIDLTVKGNRLLDAQSWSEAEWYYRKSLEVWATKEAYNNLGLALAPQGRYAEAEQAYLSSLSMDRKYGQPYNHLVNLGVELYRMNRYAEAEEIYRQLLALHPKDANTYNCLGAALEAQGQHAAALAAYSQSIKYNSKNAAPYRNTGLVLEAMERYEEAKKFYQQALRVDPHAEDARNNLADLEAKIQERAAAQAEAVRKEQDAQATTNIRAHLGTLADAFEQARSAEMHGQAGDLRRPWDSSGDKAPSGNLPMILSGGSKQPEFKVPERFQGDQKIKDLMEEKAAADRQYQDLGAQLKDLNEKMAKSDGDKGQLQVEAANVLNQMSAAKSASDTAVVKAEDRLRMIKDEVNWTPDATSGGEKNP